MSSPIAKGGGKAGLVWEHPRATANKMTLTPGTFADIGRATASDSIDVERIVGQGTSCKGALRTPPFRP